ncbi:M48 family metalloprotease [Endomicrobium proavitum]|uniref:Peptidase M48 domain-containing protein n=1 Tax=Endomicrobium proavitum TaxID=1408281 RepID=A0A0G3WI63_9BACT|nr:M48 family metalloprotease [Endomicrobium proavitum]AKL97575.1 exported protein of unknown function [Endomicrobium proavitum]
MKKLLSIVIMSVIILQSCTAVKEYTSYGIDKAATSAGIDSRATNAVKKAVTPEQKSWDYGDSFADMDIVYNASKSQKYLSDVFNKLQKQANVKDVSIYMLRTARVQALAAWGVQVKITRGMFNMINDEAELAGLMGHEIGHIALKHGETRKETRQIANKTNDVIDKVTDSSIHRSVLKKQQKTSFETGRSRKEEKDADKYGAELAAKAGYDPYALCDLFERLSQRVDLGLAYKIRKMEGSHPALDDRAQSLREYLQKKGYKQNQGKRNREQYVEGMSDLLSMHTGEGKEENKQIQKEVNEEGKKDLEKLEKIYKEVNSSKSISAKRFMEIMDEVSSLCQKYGISADDVFFDKSNKSSFMEESIVQDEPFWNIFASIKDAVSGKVGQILNTLGHVAIGAIPVVGDVVDLYELISGRDVFTGEKLTANERMLTALGILVGSGGQWRAFAKGLDGEISSLSVKEAKSSLNSAVGKVEKVSGRLGYDTTESVFDVAKSGGVHSGTYKQYVGKSNKELEKSIKSYEKLIEIHTKKISNPELFYPDFQLLDARQQYSLISKNWPQEIQLYKEQKEVIEGILKERGVL